MVICICVNVLILKGAFREDVHQRNIKFAITQFASSFTNDMMSTSYDFAAILGEIKNLKSEAIRTNLLSDLTDRLIVNPKDIWKHQDVIKALDPQTKGNTNAYNYRSRKEERYSGR